MKHLKILRNPEPEFLLEEQSAVSFVVLACLVYMYIYI